MFLTGWYKKEIFRIDSEGIYRGKEIIAWNDIEKISKDQTNDGIIVHDKKNVGHMISEDSIPYPFWKDEVIEAIRSGTYEDK